MRYCAVCLIAKDENYYLREWAEYHLRIGFDDLLIYDNGSAVPLAETLADLISLGRVRVFDAPGPFRQADVYNRCLAEHGANYKWMAFLDSDEFLFPRKTANIKIFLAEYENYGGVVAHWVMFGTSGLKEPRNNSQIFNFIRAANTNGCTIKSIVRPEKVRSYGVHGAEFAEPWFAVSSDHFPLPQDGYATPFVDDKIRINHYYFRSWADWEQKAARWRALAIKTAHGPTFEEEQREYSKPSMELIKFYAPLQSSPIEPHQPPAVIASVADLTGKIMERLETRRLDEAELLLCRASLLFTDEPMIWVLRSITARMAGDPHRALHCIREAAKLSGGSSVYFELARVYRALRLEDKAVLADQVANYKKHVEDTTCEP